MTKKAQSFDAWLAECSSLMAGDPVCDAEPDWVQKHASVLRMLYDRGWKAKDVARMRVDRGERGQAFYMLADAIRQIDELGGSDPPKHLHS